jgi:hypothetical protein
MQEDAEILFTNPVDKAAVLDVMLFSAHHSY